MRISGRHRYAVVLAVISILILVIGILLKPTPPAHSKREELTVSRAELENLERVVRRNNLRNLSNTFNSVAEEAATHVSIVAPWGVNAVRIPDLDMVVPKHLDALPRERMTDLAKSQKVVQATHWVPGMPFFTGQLSDGEVSQANLTNTTPRQGDWVMVVSYGVFGQVMMSPGIYNGIVQAECGEFIQYRFLTTIPLDRPQVGGGLFDLAGDLHGVVLPCDDGLAIVPVSELRKASYRANTPPFLPLSQFGIQFTDSAGKQAGESQVRVREVWERWPADRARIFPGDEVVSIDDHPVALVQDVVAVLQATNGPTIRLRLRRRGKPFEVTLPIISTNTSANQDRPALMVDETEGVEITAVAKGSSADRAGLRIGDRILTIEDRPATATACQKVFETFTLPEAVTLTVRRPGRRFLMQVQP